MSLYSTEVSVALPFVAADIPCTLPTNADIEASKDVFADYSGQKVVRVGKHFVIKYGININIIEEENMLFVRKATTMPVPKVYALYPDSDAQNNYIIMEYIEGETLASKWRSLSALQKGAFTTKLKLCFDELRQLPSPGYFGSLGERPLLDDIFYTRDKQPSINGPFHNEDAVNEAMAQKYLHEVQGRKIYKADFYRQALSQVLCRHAPTFTHADFQRKNIIVQIVPRKAGLWTDCQPKKQNLREVSASRGLWTAKRHVEDENKVTIVDWEKAGWYPSYWEYGVAYFACGRLDDDWGLCLRDTLTPYYAEAPWLQMLRLELWG